MSDTHVPETNGRCALQLSFLWSEYQLIKSQYENELESRKKLDMKQFLHNKNHIYIYKIF